MSNMIVLWTYTLRIGRVLIDSRHGSAGGVGENVDAADARILQLLAEDGRASLRSLAAAVGLSGPAVSDRISRLTERGIISRFTVDIDWSQLGLPILTHIALLTDKAQHIEHIVRELRKIDRIEEISIVTGSTDLLVRARVADLADLRWLLVERIWPIDGIQRVETTLAVNTQVASDFTANLLGERATPRQTDETD